LGGDKLEKAAGDGPPIWEDGHVPGQKPHFHPTVRGAREAEDTWLTEVTA